MQQKIRFRLSLCVARERLTLWRAHGGMLDDTKMDEQNFHADNDGNGDLNSAMRPSLPYLVHL